MFHVWRAGPFEKRLEAVGERPTHLRSFALVPCNSRDVRAWGLNTSNRIWGYLVVLQVRMGCK